MKDIEKLLKWLEIREENGIEFPSSLSSLKIDIDHSALLQRLLEGKDPLPIPPPRSFSYPWYDLIEKGEAHPCEVWEMPPGLNHEDFPMLVIDQFAGWKVLEKISDTEWVATHSYGDRKNPKWAEGKWRVYQIGSRVPQNPGNGSFNKLWKIEKIT